MQGFTNLIMFFPTYVGQTQKYVNLVYIKCWFKKKSELFYNKGEKYEIYHRKNFIKKIKGVNIG